MARKIAAPRGTRDLYPEDVLKRRYITQAWRDVSIRHGFEEIEGPTFEQSELYAVKSGEGILGELFQAFSGKSPEEIEEVRRTGRAPFALRPEFTPTLARMYAAKAASLSSPTKWFTAGPYFRAERPQRGRLREFLQWNCDIMGVDGGSGENAEGAEGSAEGSAEGAEARMDAELVASCIDLLRNLGLTDDYIQVRTNDRRVVASILSSEGIPADSVAAAFGLLDRAAKMAPEAFRSECERLNLPFAAMEVLRTNSHDVSALPMDFHEVAERIGGRAGPIFAFRRSMDRSYQSWIHPDLCIARGLAYYTGMVFEVIAEGERAIAGGGRYDDLISLFGGPATPAVGFGMGDVVLSLLLEDKGLMPEGGELMDAVSRPPASVRPDAFVVAEDEALDAVVTRTVARLRAGVESEAWRERGGRPWAADRYEVWPLHARRSYKATRKRDKLVKEALKQQARAVVVVESAESCTVRDLGSGPGREERVGLDGLGAHLARG